MDFDVLKEYSFILSLVLLYRCIIHNNMWLAEKDVHVLGILHFFKVSVYYDFALLVNVLEYK